MSLPGFTILILIAFGVAVGASVIWYSTCSFMLVMPRNQSSIHRLLAHVSKVPWILSIVSCFVGPFALICAPVGCVEYVRASRISKNSLCRMLPLLAICNSGLLLFSMILFLTWTLFVITGAFGK